MGQNAADLIARAVTSFFGDDQLLTATLEPIVNNSLTAKYHFRGIDGA